MTRSARSTNPGAPAWRTPAIIGGVLALAVVAGVLFALAISREPATGSGDPSPSASPIPSAPASPSEDPSPSDAPSTPAEPSEEPEDAYLEPIVANPDGLLPPGGIVRVIADALRVREQPILTAPEVAMLGRGELLIVGPTFGYGAFGPATGDGYTWVPVGVLDLDALPEPGGEPLEIVDRGWVAIGDGDSEWLELLGARCTDDEPTLKHLSSLTEWERLSCYGDRELTFDGTLGCGGCGGMIAGEFAPEWLAFPANMDFISVDPQKYIGPLNLRWSPDGPERPNTDSPVAPILRVTGHFDDAAATGCSMVFEFNTFGVQGETEVDPAVSQLYCRSQFVVDSHELIGED